MERVSGVNTSQTFQNVKVEMEKLPLKLPEILAESPIKNIESQIKKPAESSFGGKRKSPALSAQLIIETISLFRSARGELERSMANINRKAYVAMKINNARASAKYK